MFGDGRLNLSKLTAPDVTAFVQRHARRHGSPYARGLVAATRSLLRYLHYKGLIKTNLSLAVPKVARWSLSTLPKHLSATQVRQVLRHCDRSTARGRRNYAILLLLARLGLRACEIVGLNLDDIDWDNARITVCGKGRWAQLQPHTYCCLFGLLAVSGLRVGEAINLQPQDVDWLNGVLTIRGAKFGKSRLVPLHPSTRAVLLDYAKRRDEIYASRPVEYFFVTSRGTKLEKPNLSRIFRELSRQVGIRKPGVRHGPRLHDFRHRFAVETLLRWYRRGEQVTRLMPVLSTYLGHGNVTGTYWYLSQTPELMAAASQLLETRWKGVAR